MVAVRLQNQHNQYLRNMIVLVLKNHLLFCQASSIYCEDKEQN